MGITKKQSANNIIKDHPRDDMYNKKSRKIFRGKICRIMIRILIKKNLTSFIIRLILHI